MIKVLKYSLFFILVTIATVAAKIALTIARLPDLNWYITNTPAITAMMKYNRDEKKARITPVPIENISPHLIRAVLLAEDVAFFQHSGIDWGEFRLSLKQNWERKAFYRGGSTITMQLARNLFLTPSKNPIRKIEEMVIATILEKKLSKKRILELYLNVAEWGPHIYGAESASQYYFGISAKYLSVDQACALASILPSPKKWNPVNPTPGVKKRIEKLKEKFNTLPLKIPDEITSP